MVVVQYGGEVGRIVGARPKAALESSIAQAFAG
jgi:hypothetical protein